MKCQFIDNDDFFEGYILDRIDEAEKRTFEAHLSECKSCSEKLAQQEKLLAAIREVGRAEMKAEIKQQAELAASEKFNWGAVTRVAALAFIFILTPTMFYIYKNQVQPESAPLAQRIAPPQFEEAEIVEGISLDSESMDKLESIPTKKEAKLFQVATKSNIQTKKKNRVNKSLAKSQFSMQAPELQMQLKGEVAKEDSKTEQSGAQDLDEATEIDALSLAGADEVADFVVIDKAPRILPQNEPIPVRLNSMSGAAVRSESENFNVSGKLFSNSSLEKDDSNIFSKTITLSGRTVGLRLIIKPGAEASPNVKWPDEFPVSVTKPDSSRIILRGELTANQNISHADFSAKGISENEIEILFGKSATYRIKIDRAGSKAIRID